MGESAASRKKYKGIITIAIPGKRHPSGGLGALQRVPAIINERYIMIDGGSALSAYRLLLHVGDLRMPEEWRLGAGE